MNEFISNIDAKYHLGISVALGISSDKETKKDAVKESAEKPKEKKQKKEKEHDKKI